MTATVTIGDRAQQATLALLDEFLAGYAPGNFRVRLWDGTVWEPHAQEPAALVLALNHRGALKQLFAGLNDVALAEAYLYDDVDLEGDIEALGPLVDALLARPWRFVDRLRLARRLLTLPSVHRDHDGTTGTRLHGRAHSPGRDRQAVSYHYDVSNDFYALWLDRQLVYSCAYFHRATDNLDAAQRAKLDYVCRKLRLRPGERFLDIGCGWGGLILHAARQYGVRATGITLSQRQAELARERIRGEGLSERCEVLVCDYRELDRSGHFQKMASIGMCEHVGARMLPEYFASAWRLLAPGGVFLNHGIERPANVPAPRGPTFITRYVFPDGELEPLSVLLEAAEKARFEVRDVESLREHYALTLRHWLARLEAAKEQARSLAGEVKYRVWRLFIALSAHAFRTGGINVYQTLLVKPDRGDSRLPLTRADWYR